MLAFRHGKQSQPETLLDTSYDVGKLQSELNTLVFSDEGVHAKDGADEYQWFLAHSESA